MALLAEQLVDEWLNRKGFFTLRGARSGVAEIDLLGVRQRDGALEGWHVEVQVSFRPVSYLSRLAKSDQDELKAQSPTSAKARPAHILQRGIDVWVEKKFRANTKLGMRDQVWPGIPRWKEFFVHGKVRDEQELAFIQKHGIELVPFSDVLDELSKPKKGQVFGAAGTDIAEIIRYYEAKPDRKP